jgi:hypothetical protein
MVGEIRGELVECEQNSARTDPAPQSTSTLVGTNIHALACAERRKRHHLVALDSTQMKHRNFTKLMSHGILSWKNLHFNSSSVNSIVPQIELQSEARALPNSTFTRQTGTYKKKREERKKQKR